LLAHLFLNQALRRDINGACGCSPPIGLAGQRLGSNQ
jgi:hypothetical protein